MESVESRLERERGSPILASCDRDEETGETGETSECGARAAPESANVQERGAAYDEIATEFVVARALIVLYLFSRVNRHGRRRRTAEPRRVRAPVETAERAGRGSLAASPGARRTAGGRPERGVPPARGPQHVRPCITYRFWHALWPTSMAHTPLDVSVTHLRSTSRARAHDLDVSVTRLRSTSRARAHDLDVSVTHLRSTSRARAASRSRPSTRVRLTAKPLPPLPWLERASTK